ncbi:MAG: hypothetical protein JKX85_10775 [Phycisphaeraceae bacterium]|nr:hypothetical protein [Phycisphaeraceae bacterium]
MTNRPVVVMGSSVFEQWFNVQDVFPYDTTINIAVPGSTTRAWKTWLAHRVLPLNPKTVLFYAGSNDLVLSCPVDDILQRTCQILQTLHATIPDCRAYYFSIIRAPQKEPLWDQVNQINQAMQTYATQHHWLEFVDINPVFFDDNGQGNTELFIEDQLHLTTAAYGKLLEYTQQQFAKSSPEKS